MANATLTDVDNSKVTQLSLQVSSMSDGNNDVLSIDGTSFSLATSVTNQVVSAFKKSSG
ncbi:MAG: hypothetical protein EoVTN8_1489 [Fluviibacter phosphoraccumulans EoVTN8]